ncbi:acyl-CoA dehydrogenase family protein [Streptomyces sp. MP131-18]|uniref:acyl-CoA dehydrogenase family protein n=1 Tax=Streptomyces sp. MP131-18 TaxID=1857892 RepID=UPI00097C52F8|nr:acyl-CoA dehydrogenase family protein [Streptomyces sp. MP131-18]ONK09793.1 Flavin-dependent monooxygenase, oxygenase subunit HsaA [Streptomyces sp. MP131-18]
MTPTQPTGASVLEAVRAAVPTLRANGREAEERRWLPGDNIRLLDEAGVFRMAVPGRFGGLDLPLAEQFTILEEISRGCGSTGWTAASWVSTAWMITLYPDSAQEEVFAEGTVRVSGGFTPGGTVTPTEGGYLLDGTWRFNTGCRAADWDMLAALLEKPDGSVELVYALVPMDELEIADDWYVSAASATGSSTATAKSVFVPEHRIADGEAAVEGTLTDRWNSGATGRNYGLIGLVMTEAVAVYIGMAQAAFDLFVERLPGRAIAYTNWEDQSRHPLTQLTVAQAENRIAAARALADEVVDLLQRRADAGEYPTTKERATVHGRCGFAIQSLKEAVELLHSVSGASALARSAPFQRFYRDLEGLSLHGMMAPATNLEVHGRALLGLEPDTPVL